MQLRRIDRIGVELEGAWNYDPDYYSHANASGERANMGEDCSVRCEGEVISGGELRSAPSTWEGIRSLMSTCYPDVVDSSCGMHVHISLKSKLDYCRLMARPFYDFFLREITYWASNNVRAGSRFWNRLEGTSYAQADIFEPEMGVYGGEADRYAFLNFNAYGRFGTLEIRLLPMFNDSRVAIKAVRETLEIVERYLRSQPRETAKRRTLHVPAPGRQTERAVYPDADATPLELAYGETTRAIPMQDDSVDDAYEPIVIAGCDCATCENGRAILAVWRARV
jgi:hypothetical protein